MLIKLPELLQMVCLGKSSTYNQISDGLLPHPVSIGARSVAWVRSEVEEIVKARIAGQSDDEIRNLVKRLEAKRALCASL